MKVNHFDNESRFYELVILNFLTIKCNLHEFHVYNIGNEVRK